MDRLKQTLEDAAVVLVGSVLVLALCAVYWIARLFGVRLESDF